jgi:hypothetical protein
MEDAFGVEMAELVAAQFVEGAAAPAAEPAVFLAVAGRRGAVRAVSAEPTARSSSAAAACGQPLLAPFPFNSSRCGI